MCSAGCSGSGAVCSAGCSGGGVVCSAGCSGGRKNGACIGSFWRKKNLNFTYFLWSMQYTVHTYIAALYVR